MKAPVAMTSTTLILAIAAAFVAGTITTGTMAYAASNAQGQPFQEIQTQIDSFFDIFATKVELQDEEQARISADETLQERIESLPSSDFTVDSFFDVMYQIEFNPDKCPSGEVPKLTEDLTGTTCIPEGDLAVDSFFDVFYDMEALTKENQDKIDTEILQLDLHSADPAAHHPRYTDEEARSAVGPHTVDTNAGTICAPGQYLDGDGTCKTISSSGAPSFTTYIVKDSIDCGPELHCHAQADCDSGDVALSGGYNTSNAMDVYQNLPVGLPEASGWAATGYNEADTVTVKLSTYAVCLDKTP